MLDLDRIVMNIVPSEVDKVAEQLKKEEPLYEIWRMSAAHNLIASAGFKDVEDLQDFEKTEQIGRYTIT